MVAPATAVMPIPISITGSDRRRQLKDESNTAENLWS